MWKLFVYTFLCLFLTTSCDDDTSGDVKTTQIAAAAVQLDSGSNGNSGPAAAVAQITSVKTEELSGPSLGSESRSNSSGGSYDDGSSSEEDDYDCNAEELDDDYDCTSALPRVQLAIIKIGFIRKNHFLKNNFINYNNYCNINHTQGNEGHIGSPLSTWYVLAMIALYTEDETLDELLDFLGLENKDECGCVMKKLRRLNKPFLKNYFYYTTLVMGDNKSYFTDLFKIDVHEYLDGKVVNTNFSDSLSSARKANKVAAAKYRNLFVDVVSKQEASTVFNADQIIINVIGTYLKADFKIPFSTENKTKGIYYGLNEPTITEFLPQEVRIYNSTESKAINAWLIEIELKNNNTKLLIIFPKTRCGLQTMVAKLASEPQILLDELKCLKPTLMSLTVPVYKNFTYVENVVPALQSTCDIDRVFDITKSQIIDSCGRPLNRSITYIHEKSTIVLPALGTEPYKKASANDCSDCGEAIDVCINYSAVFVYMADGVAVETAIVPVENEGPFTNE